MNKYHEKEKDYVSKKLIEECIDEMKPSNCFGWDGVNTNMIKNGKSNSLVYLIKSLINAIKCSGFIPNEFNRTIIKLIIKDNKKKTFDINNFRPVSISNFFAQIFERVILKLSSNQI